MEGWVKLHRKTLENPVVCKDSDHFFIWCFLLLSATHKEKTALFGGKKIMLSPGQLITGRKSLSAKTGVSESKIKRILMLFESDQQIDRQRSNQNSLITILNWADYQQSDQPSGQPMDSKWTADGQQVTTNKNVRRKECKNERTKEKDTCRFAPPTQDEIKSYCLERKNNVDAERFFDFYEAKGWMVGKNKMKDWKAAVRTWEKNDTSGGPVKSRYGEAKLPDDYGEGEMPNGWDDVL